MENITVSPLHQRLIGISQGIMYVSTLTSFPVVCVYLMCIVLAPLWRKLVSPLQLRYVLVVYNMLCCLVGVLTCYGITTAIYRTRSLFMKRRDDAVTYYLFIYYVTKYVELLDTVFMILRHKQRQISWLHVFHHSSILLLADITYHDYPWVTISIYLSLNSLVHFFLYLYYGLSAMFPDSPPQWKRAMTQLQILQFAVGMVHSTFGYLHHGFCIYGIIYGVIMTGMFLNFYYHAYSKTRAVVKGAKKST